MSPGTAFKLTVVTATITSLALGELGAVVFLIPLFGIFFFVLSGIIAIIRPDLDIGKDA